MNSCVEAGGTYPDGPPSCGIPETPETAIVVTIVMAHEDGG